MRGIASFAGDIGDVAKLDHEFFLNEVEDLKKYHPLKKIKSIGINIAVDLKSLRYSSIDYDTFNKK